MNKKLISAVTAVMCAASFSFADSFELIKFGNMDNWLTRNIKESKLLGGKTRQVYEIAPNGTDDTGKAYSNRGGSPWATSNVLASPSGIVKTSNAVYPDTHEGKGKCAKMVCEYEHCKAVGMINIDVIVGGSIFLGEMLEPVKSTKDPYSKMIMGIPFTKRPKSIRFDYKVSMPPTNERVYSSGFGKKKTLKGSDHGEVIVWLQRRWEDAKGNVYAHRVGTAVEYFTKSTSGWVNGHNLNIQYGDISKGRTLDTRTGLMPTDRRYCTKNSKGKIVPIQEVGWDPVGTAPTHAIVMFSSSGGEAYIGTLGLTVWVDNVGFVY
jgi:hypothetical protein